MFEGIKLRWAEARADVAGKEVRDILERFQQMHESDRYLVVSAFEYSLSGLEEEAGPLLRWSSDDKRSVAKELMAAAMASFKSAGNNLLAETGRIGAYGGALLALYLELQLLPGANAIATVKQIESW